MNSLALASGRDAPIEDRSQDKPAPSFGRSRRTGGNTAYAVVGPSSAHLTCARSGHVQAGAARDFVLGRPARPLC